MKTLLEDAEKERYTHQAFDFMNLGKCLELNCCLGIIFISRNLEHNSS